MRYMLILALLLAAVQAEAVEAEEPPIHDQPKNPGVAGMLSFFIPGAGHFYCDENLTGGAYLVGTYGLAAGTVYTLLRDNAGDDPDKDMTMFMVFAWSTIALHGVDVIHAMHSAREYNLRMSLAAGPRGQPALMVSFDF